MAEVLEKVKISELNLVQDYANLYTIGTDWQLHSVKVPLSVLATIGSVSNLDTANKSTLVAAINEVLAAAQSGGSGGLSGYVVVSSISNLPDPGQANLGYLVGENLYLYVGTGGDTLNGKYKNCGAFRGPQGPQGIQGPQGFQGETGAPGVTSVNVVVTPSTGTPGGSCALVDGALTITLSGLKGETGAQGATGGQGTQGPQGPQGLQGETGPAGVSRVIVNVTNTTGVPAANAALDNGVLTITLSGIKGETGNTGSSVDFPFELVDNCIDGGRNKALSAEQGKILNQKIDEKFVFLTEQQFEELSSYDATKIYCTYES